jgi:hypothetical protein
MTAPKLTPMYPVNDDAPVIVTEHIPGGFYLKARCIQNSAIAIAPPHVREIWDWILKEANHKPMNTYGKTIGRGQLLTDYKEIQDGLHWKEGYIKKSYKKHHVDYAMRWLRQERMVTTQKTTRGLIITVCKYDRYQNPANYENANGYDNQKTIKRQPTDRINKNDKNSKNENSSTPPKDWLYSNKGFFDRQLAANEKESFIQEYRDLVEFLHGKNRNALVFENVLSLQKQISYKDFVNLKETAKTSSRTIGQVLADMENTAQLSKKYKNAYLTVNKWLQNDFKK